MSGSATGRHPIAAVCDGVPATDSPGQRPLRADARRNRDALLTAAAAVFATGGVDASLEEVARRAHVGIGTLYRHFPTRDALIADLYRREVELLCGGIDELLLESAPDEALRVWMHRFIGHVARKKGLATALKSLLGMDSELFDRSRRCIRTAVSTLVEAGAAAGVIRSGVDPDDLLRAMGGFCAVSDEAGWQDRANRLVDLLVDGLRYQRL